MTPRTPHILQGEGVSLVFGMEWFPLLGGQPHKQGAALARRRRAGHYVVSSGAAASVGLMHGRAGRREASRLRSAAAVFAGLHPVGAVAAVLPLPDRRQWLVAVHEGAVMTRADQLHEHPDTLNDTLRLLREAHPGLQVHDEAQTPSGLLDTLLKAAQDQGRLIRTRRLPGVALLAVCLLPALFLVLQGRSLFSGTVVEQAADIDPAVAWRGAVAQAASRHLVHGVAGLHSVLDALQATPAYLAGWLLVRVSCEPRLNTWQCRANYRRDQAGDNQSLMDAALPGWSLTFDPMEGSVAAWSASMSALPLGEVRLRAPRQNDTRLMSALQALLPAFQELRLEAPQPLPIVAPLDIGQRPLPRPEGIPAYQRRAVHLQAPLRSLSLLLPEAVHMSWERVVLDVAPLDQPTLRNSSLRVSMSGVLYESDNTNLLPAAGAAGLVAGAGRVEQP